MDRHAADYNRLLDTEIAQSEEQHHTTVARQMRRDNVLHALAQLRQVASAGVYMDEADNLVSDALDQASEAISAAYAAR